MLETIIPKYYKVKRGQTAKEIAEAFSVPECTLIGYNGLKEEVCAGQVLRIPAFRGNLYTVCAGDTKTLLSGSEENFDKTNCASLLYPGMKVWI